MEISRWDDYLIHQIAKPIDTVGTHDENFMDRLWFMAYTGDGSLQMMAGLGVYSNKAVMDTFLLIRHRGVQHNFRAYRQVQGDRAATRIGPLRFDAVVPQQHWRIILDDKETGIGCSLDFHARVAPFLFPELGFPQQEQMHYEQPGRCDGTLTVAGETFPGVGAAQRAGSKLGSPAARADRRHRNADRHRGPLRLLLRDADLH
jgi:hypothetical protein